MGKSKTKAIQTDLGTIRHNQAYPGIIQVYSSIFKTLCNPGIFRTVIYPEPWHIQNQNHIQIPGVFRTLVYSKFEAYLEPCQTTTMKHFAKIVNGYNFFRKL